MQPLSRKFRTTFFWVLVTIFIIATPLLIGYSKGYRLGDALSVVETGGIYIHSDIANTSIHVDGVFVEQNGAFLKNTFIQDLKPNRKYELSVTRDGYQSWIKQLSVRSNLVTEARVLMLPSEFEWRIIAASTTVAVVDVGNRRVTETDNASTTATSTIVANPEYEKMVTFFEGDMDQFAVEVATSTFVTVKGKRVATTTTAIELQFPSWLDELASTTALTQKEMVRERDGIVTWIDKGNLYAMWGRKNEQIPFYFCTATCTPTLVIDWSEPIMRYEFYPSRNDVVIIGTERGVYAVELDERSQRNIQPFIEGSGLDFRILADGSIVVRDDVEFREATW